jgi:3-oxoacyl-ACP reductase-like protein
MAQRAEDIDWSAIIALYDSLMQINTSPIVRTPSSDLGMEKKLSGSIHCKRHYSGNEHGPAAGQSPAADLCNSEGVDRPRLPVSREMENTMNPRMLQDKNAVVFGAGGSIGAAIAKEFAAEGARVFLGGRTKASMQAVAKQIVADGGDAQAL